MSSATRKTHNSLGIESTLMSNFKEVIGDSTLGWSPDRQKFVGRGGFQDANFFFRDLYEKVLTKMENYEDDWDESMQTIDLERGHS